MPNVKTVADFTDENKEFRCENFFIKAEVFKLNDHDSPQNIKELLEF